ncbi:hypothetical protein TSOC_008689 [Tetrabaena socialis]|uniref:Uncharacterized protein n=1 Tax=Tetrabaena socialis TaxID=47790 RepID=A0A2J7ZXT3_9CHLO|nr:hypothetical protein TSOC_008689 [Tetrabaena socialis]|eukprot:PNH05078.1 hypothetical protein TSOC_008689 [Tetrabaena socialis]
MPPSRVVRATANGHQPPTDPLLEVVLQLGDQQVELLQLLGLAHVHQPVLELEHEAAQQLAVDLRGQGGRARVAMAPDVPLS